MFVYKGCERRWHRLPPQLLQGISASGLARRRPARAIISTAATAPVLPRLTGPGCACRTYTSDAPKSEPAKKSSPPTATVLSLVPPSDPEKLAKLKRRANKQLKYSHDPYAILKHVEQVLEKNDAFDEALMIARVASAKNQVAATWNRLIMYSFEKGSLKTGIKLFNEMKKRGQLPNAHTYTTIFSGCSSATDPAVGVYNATRIYYAMMNDERMQPNKIHMNAVLNVCAKAGDLESMFAVAKTANNAQRSPDAVTYATVLNGLLHHTIPIRKHSIQMFGDVEGVDLDREEINTAIKRARSVWSEVVQNWQQGRLMIDEYLVCAMANTLLLGSHRDKDDVLSLVEQTIGIPRLDRKNKEDSQEDQKEQQETAPAAAEGALEADSKAEGSLKPGAKQTPQDDSTAEVFTPLPVSVIGPKLDATSDTKESIESTESTERTESTESDKSAAVTAVPSGGISRVMYAQPSAHILSATLKSLTGTRKTSLVMPYWNTFTNAPYNVEPDLISWTRLLKAFQRGHASGKSAEMLQKVPLKYLNRKMFRIAMTTCTDDNLNENVFATAGKILDLMTQTMRVPDPLVLRLYLQTAVTNNRRFFDIKKLERKLAVTPATEAEAREITAQRAALAAEKELARVAYGRQVVRALSRLWDPLRRAGNGALYEAKGSQNEVEAMITSQAPLSSLRDLGTPLAYSPEEDGRKETYNARREIVALARQMVSAADMVVSEGMADEATIKDLRISRNLLNRQITRFYEVREKFEPNLKRNKEAGTGNSREKQSSKQNGFGDDGVMVDRRLSRGEKAAFR